MLVRFIEEVGRFEVAREVSVGGREPQVQYDFEKKQRMKDYVGLSKVALTRILDIIRKDGTDVIEVIVVGASTKPKGP